MASEVSRIENENKPSTPCTPKKTPKKQVKVTEESPTYYEDEAKKGKQLYTTLSKYVCHVPQTRHGFLRNTPAHTHWQSTGQPYLLWYDYTTRLINQRTQLTLLKKLYNQKYYTVQFLFKLQQVLALQREVENSACYFAAFSLVADSSKLPKINVLCKQIVSLLNDLEACSHAKLARSGERSAAISTFLIRYRSLLDEVTGSLVSCVRTTRQILLNELRFCYLFSNFRSRVYGSVEQVVQFNDIVFHPLLAGVHPELVITLETVIALNCSTAAAYIARSFHQKILTIHGKSVPVVEDSSPGSLLASIRSCGSCMKQGHFLHSYCFNKKTQFLDAMSVMIQGANEQRVSCRTDSCTSAHVEEQLSRALLTSLHQLASSSLLYEPRLCSDTTPGGRCLVRVVHEQYLDLTRKASRRRWEENFSTVVYSYTSRGLPTSWRACDDLPHFTLTLKKLETSYYSEITAALLQKLNLDQLTLRANTDLDVLLSRVRGDVRGTGFTHHTSLLISQLNRLSYTALSDSGFSEAHARLLQVFVSHLCWLLRTLYFDYERVLLKHSQDCALAKWSTSYRSLYELLSFLESLHKQLHFKEETSLPSYLVRSLREEIAAAQSSLALLKELLHRAVTSLEVPLHRKIRDKFTDSLPSSYWKGDNFGVEMSPCFSSLATFLEGLIAQCSILSEHHKSRVHHLIVEKTAQTMLQSLVNNKKIQFSSSGVHKLDKNVQELIDRLKELIPNLGATPLILKLRNDLNSLVSKRGKNCTCNSRGGNWKRRSEPQLSCARCTSTNGGPSHQLSNSLLKPPSSPSSRQIFSDSEVDVDNVSQNLRIRQKRTLKSKLGEDSM